MAPPALLSTTRSKRRKVEGAPDGAAGLLLGRKAGRGLYHCDYCRRDLSSALHIKCAVCPDFDLCLDCFSVGAAVAPHQPGHAYRLAGNLSFPVYARDWGADEESLLLEAIELYGLGNWEAVAEHAGRPPAEVRAHYFRVYVETGSAFPDPVPQADMDGVDIAALIEAHRLAGGAAAPRIAAMPQDIGGLPGSTVSNGTKEEEEGPSVPVAASQSGVPLGREKLGSGKRQPTVQTASEKAESKLDIDEGAPASSEQEKEGVDSKAKLGLQSTDGEEGDVNVKDKRVPVGAGRQLAMDPALVAADPLLGTPSAALGSDVGAKVALSEAQQTGYHIKRNEFEQEFDPEAECIISEMEFKEDDSPEVVEQKLELITIYNRRLDERERRKAFILERGLLNVRRQGAVDRRRTPTERKMAGALRAFARYLPQPQFEALADGMLAETRLRARIEELQQYRSLGLRTFEQVDMLEAGGDRSKIRKDHAPPSQAARAKLNRVPIDEVKLQECLLGGLGFAHAALALHARRTSIEDGRGTSGLAAWRGQRGTLLDITMLPDGGPLLQQERRLCAAERYLPAQYLAIKAEVLAIQEEKGCVKPEDVTALSFKIDGQRLLRLHEFFVEQGWIKEQ